MTHAAPHPSTPAHATLDQSPLALTPEPLPYTSPPFQCSIPAGFPSPAADYIEDGLDLNEYLVRHRASSFLFRVQDHSTRDAGIVDGDKVVVDRSIEPQHNQIVIAVADSEYTIKRLYRKNGGVELRSENPAFKLICFKTESQLEIWGVVVGVVRRYQYKKCGVMLMELTVKAQRQETLFGDVATRDKAAKIMAVMDCINRVCGACAAMRLVTRNAGPCDQRIVRHGTQRSGKNSPWRDEPTQYKRHARSGDSLGDG